MRVFVAGATGTIGRRLVPLLVRDDHEVIAMTRSEGRAEWLRSQGVQPVICDVFEREKTRRVIAEAEPEVLMHQLSSIPRRLNPRRINEELAETNQLRTLGTLILVEAAKAAGVKRFIAQSVAIFYAPNGRSPAVEDDDLYRDLPGASELVDAVHVHEHAVLGSFGMDGVVLRYGSFYGPGTFYAQDGSFAEDVRRRRIPIIGEGKGTFSFIHVQDAAEITASFVTHGEPGTYNIVDDEPSPVVRWLPYYADVLQAPQPFHLPRFVGRLGAGPYGTFLMTRQRGASNQKVKESLGWHPKYSSWREGFPKELGL